MMGSRGVWAMGALAGFALGASGQPTSPVKPNPPAKGQSKATGVNLDAELDAIWAAVEGEEPLKKLGLEAERVFQQAIAYGTHTGPGANQLIRAAATRRLLVQLSDNRNTSAAGLRTLLAQNPRLAQTLALSVKPQDDLAGVYARLAELAEKFPEAMADKQGGGGSSGGGAGSASATANLAAAVCVVFDQKRPHPTEGADSASAEDVFAFFKLNASRMAFPLDKTPVELLTHVVDVSCTKDDMAWALGAYAGNRSVGKLFSSISYDTEVLKRGAQKKVLALGPGQYTLANIKKVGGVCAEQAYFASEVGKCIGVPTVFVAAAGSDAGHAWVGYLKSDRHWDFSEGREGEYEDLSGTVLDAQTVKPVLDSAIGLTGGLLESTPEQRDLATALMDGAEVMATVRRASGSWPPAAPEGAESAKARALGVQSESDLLDAASKACAANPRLWMMIGAMAEKGDLSEQQRQKWADALFRVTGRNAPDFAMQVLRPMIRAVQPIESQNRMWEWAAQQFQHRPDLAASARVDQAAMWAKAGDQAKAFAAYQEIINRYSNEGKVLISALAGAEKLLTGKRDAVLKMYEDAFRRVSKPKSSGEAFWRSSNYYIVGSKYADLLRDAGKKTDAERIEKQIEPKKDKKGFGD